MVKQLDDIIEIPDMSPEEFKFIRVNAGVTMLELAKFLGKRSRSCIWGWERQKRIKPYQIKILMQYIPEDLFNACRRQFESEKHRKKR
jgi:DNA-binding transcriptional regulator YiaG